MTGGAPGDGRAPTGLVADSAQPWSAPGGDTGALVLHGFTGNPTSMRPLARRLADDGMAVELPLLPGHGTHWKDLARTTWRDWAREAGAALDRLHARADAVAVVGLSMGGTLALHLAETRAAALSAVVVINPSLTFRHPLRSVAGSVGRVVRTIPGLGNDIARPGADELPYDRVPLRAAASLFAMQDQVRADLGVVHTPLLVLTSRTDHTVPPSDSTIVLDSVASTAREQVWLERSYHVATLDHDADLIAERTIAFVREHTGRRDGDSSGPGANA